MPTYYDILKIQPTATVTEIEIAYETQYTQWRRLVTHHDAQMVNQANQALQQLELIRTTLLDPRQRSAYDAGIGVGGTIGGLFDPSVLLRSLPQEPNSALPAPVTTAAPVQAAPMVARGLWTCYKCHTDNPPNTKFCFSCGAQLVRECPECGKESSLAATGMCGHCGYKYEDALARKELRAEIIDTVAKMMLLNDQLKETQDSGAIGCLAISGAVCLLIALTAFGQSFLGGLLVLCVAVSAFWAAWQHGRNRQAKVATIEAEKAQLAERVANLFIPITVDNKDIDPELRLALQRAKSLAPEARLPS